MAVVLDVGSLEGAGPLRWREVVAVWSSESQLGFMELPCLMKLPPAPVSTMWAKGFPDNVKHAESRCHTKDGEGDGVQGCVEGVRIPWVIRLAACVSVTCLGASRVSLDVDDAGLGADGDVGVGGGVVSGDSRFLGGDWLLGRGTAHGGG